MWMIRLQVNDWVDVILGIKEEKQRLRSDDPNAFFRLFTYTFLWNGLDFETYFEIFYPLEIYFFYKVSCMRVIFSGVAYVLN